MQRIKESAHLIEKENAKGIQQRILQIFYFSTRTEKKETVTMYPLTVVPILINSLAQMVEGQRSCLPQETYII